MCLPEIIVSSVVTVVVPSVSEFWNVFRIDLPYLKLSKAMVEGNVNL